MTETGKRYGTSLYELAAEEGGRRGAQHEHLAQFPQAANHIRVDRLTYLRVVDLGEQRQRLEAVRHVPAQRPDLG